MIGTAWLLLLVFVGALGIGAPIALAVAAACMAFLLASDLPLFLVAHHMVTAVDSFTLIAVPGFLLVGTLMARAGMIERLVEFSMALVGWMAGGLSLVTISASMIFAGISGSAVADTAAVGSSTIPALKRNRYAPDYVAALVAAGGSIGIIIPPSIPMIIYGVSTNTSIPKLFVAGYVPGILLGLSFMVYAYVVAKRKGYGEQVRFSRVALGASFRKAFWALLAPVIIVGGIVLGVMTPTESGIVGVAYVLAIGTFVHRSLGVRDLVDSFVEAITLSGVVMMVVATSGLLAWILAREGIPEQLVGLILGGLSNEIAILLVINLTLLVLGAFMDTIAIMLILLPVLTPVGLALGLDAVHFGVIVVFNLAIGMLTPPLGYCLFVSSTISKVNLGAASLRVLPFVAISLFILALVTFWPSVTLGLANLVQ